MKPILSVRALLSPPPSSDAAAPAPAPYTSLPERATSRVVRRSHKSADARRRRREAAVIDHLGRLSCPDVEPASSSSDAVNRLPPPRHPNRTSRTARSSQRDRLAILEASAQRIQQLEALVRRLAQNATSVVAATAVHASSSELDSSLLPLPQPAAINYAAATSSASSAALSSPECMEILTHACSHNSLYSSLVLHSRLALVLLDVDSGMILDVSSPFLTLCGWPRSALVNVPMSPPLYFDSRLRRYGAQFTPRDAAAFLPHRYRPLMRAITDNTNEESEADDAKQPQMVPLVGCKQYPAVLHDLQQWIEGRAVNFKGPIRKRWADGRLYELDTAVWSVETREVRGEDGGKRHVPTRAVLISAIDDSIQVDEL